MLQTIHTDLTGKDRYIKICRKDGAPACTLRVYAAPPPKVTTEEDEFFNSMQSGYEFDFSEFKEGMATGMGNDVRQGGGAPGPSAEMLRRARLFTLHSKSAFGDGSHFLGAQGLLIPTQHIVRKPTTY